MAAWIAAVAAAIAATVAVITLFRVQQVHLSLNSRLDQWRAETSGRLEDAHAKGRQDERDEAHS